MLELSAELLGVLLMVLGVGIGFNLRELRVERLKNRGKTKR